VITFAPSWIQLLTLLVTVLLPLLVGLVTTSTVAGGTKALLLAALAAATGLGGELLDALTRGQVYDLAAGLSTALTAFLIAVGLHYGLWKPLGLSRRLQLVGAHRDENGVYDVTSLPAPAKTPNLGPIDRVHDGPDHRAE
jgi:hypothetical protein